jgi:hypothetical protein
MTFSPAPPTSRIAMRSLRVPLSRMSSLRGIATLCLLASAAWAFWPLSAASVSVPNIEITTSHSTAPALPPIDLAAFHTPLWVAPPPPPPVTIAASPPPPPPPPPPLPPLKWQLLAIVHHGQGYRAIVYDPDSDKVLTLAEGDESGPRRIARVTPTSIDVRDTAGLRTLSLRDTPGARQ